MKALYKDFFRGMLRNKGKFISVFLIILLGAAFFSGLRSSRSDMLLSAEKYYDSQNLYDLSVVGTAGLTYSDVEDLENLPEVEKAEGAHTLDVLCNTEERRVVKLISYSSEINIPTVLEGGRLPEKEDECLLDSLLLELGEYNIGDKIEFLSGDSSDLASQLKYSSYTITGFANLPQYMDLNRGTGTIGNGDIDGFVLISPQAFLSSYYTQINILVDGVKNLNSFEDSYDTAVSAAEEKIASISGAACERRYEELLAMTGLPEEFAQTLVTMPQWYILGRDTVFSYVNYQSDAERIANLGKLLPIVFFLVAALVSLTAMTRMVEEERQQIGTLKALGSGNGAVLLRYLSYALIPAFAGSVIGVLIGEKLFPLAILNTYALLYQGLTSFVLPYNLAEGAIAVLASVICTTVATLFASLRISRECPAQIMRPEAPKPGKRVLMERVPFVWNRLKFTQKSTIRNMFRNKKRFFMTIIGVAGCMGLVLVGLGLHDSIMVVVDKQYTELTHYQAYVSVEEGITEQERGELIDDITDGEGDITAFVVYQKSVDAQGDGAAQTVTLSVPETEVGIENYFTFRTRKGHKTVTLSEGGAILSEKTAKTLGIEAGDSISFRDGNLNTVSITISAIYENYIGNYMFMTASTYESLFGSEPSYNQILLKYSDSSEEFQNQLASEILLLDNVQGLSFTSTLVDWASDTLSSLNTIVIIVICAAALLALVVLYNLNSINIAERKRELATLKVLGFYDAEVASYIYKENILLTIIGIILGIVFGIFLHQYVIMSIEVDLIMFGRSIYWYSYIIGAFLTLAFSAIINLIMYGTLKKIDMIESLKSIE